MKSNKPRKRSSAHRAPRPDVVDFATIGASLGRVWPRIEPVLDRALNPGRARRSNRFDDRAIFRSLLRAYFEGLPLRKRQGTASPPPRCIYHKLDVWTSGGGPVLPDAWRTYLRAIPLRELRAWRARLLGFRGPVAPLGVRRCRYVGGGPPPELLNILLAVWDARARRPKPAGHREP